MWFDGDMVNSGGRFVGMRRGSEDNCVDAIVQPCVVVEFNLQRLREWVAHGSVCAVQLSLVTRI